MPNVSASLSDEAYEAWKAYPGKKSPWISELITESGTLVMKNEALNTRVGYLQGVISSMLTQLYLARGGWEHDNWSEEQVLFWNLCLDCLEGSIHYHNHRHAETS